MKLSEACSILRKAGIESAKHDASEIFSEIGGVPRNEILLSDVATSDERVIRAIERRAEREPLQYIIGKAYFYDEVYEVNENVLIPRSDTEILVEYAVKNIPDGKRFLDLCTGSGCVGISTLKHTRTTSAVLVDISERALEVAKRNAGLNGVSDRAEFLLADVMSEAADGDFYAVLSNPPYVKPEVYSELEAEIFHEPKIAFLGGEDGCDFYRELTRKYKDKISSDGFIAYEIGYDQADALSQIAEKEGLFCKIIKDYSGNDRVAVLSKSER